MTDPARGLLVVVTGLSGAGKSTALRALEDLGFFCVDNLPTSVFSETLSACDAGGISLVALGIDVRVRAFLGEAGSALQLLEAGGHRDLQVLFLDASDERLLHRFSESRRPHPLSAESGHEGALAVLDGVRIEREPESLAAPTVVSPEAGKGSSSWSTLMPSASGTESSAWIPAIRPPKEGNE